MTTLNVKKLNWLKAIIGLIGKNKPEPILFKTRFGIYTFFMRFPIDVIILDNKYKVVKLKENLKPNSIFVWNPKYNIVLELPAGTINYLRLAKSCSMKVRLEQFEKIPEPQFLHHKY